MNFRRELQFFPAFCFTLFLALPGGFSQETDLLDSVSDMIENTSLEENQKGNWGEGSLKIQGEHALLGAVLLLSDAPLSDEVAPVLENRVRLSFDQGRGLALAAGLELQSTLKKVGLNSQLQHKFRPAETYVGLYNLDGIWSLYLGWLNFSWGAADQISPIDILNPFDLNLSPRRQKKLSVLGGQFQLQPLPWLGLEAAYLPFYQTDQVDVLSKVKSQLLKGRIVLDKAGLDFSEPTLGGRLRFYLPNFDIGLSYLFAPDSALSPVPELTFNPKDRMYLLATLRLKRKQLHYWGLDLRLALPQLSLWLDTAFALNTAWKSGSYAVRSPRISSVLGAEFYYGPEQKFYTNFQYGMRWLPGYRINLPDLPGPGKAERDYQDYYLSQFNDRLAGYQEGLLQRFMLHMAFPFTLSGIQVNVKPELNLLYELPLLYDGTRQHHIYLNPELELSWDWQTSASHSLQFGIALGLEWFAKLEQNAIERGRYADQAYLELRLLW